MRVNTSLIFPAYHRKVDHQSRLNLTSHRTCLFLDRSLVAINVLDRSRTPDRASRCESKPATALCD
jgi:hypothetical protein